jgi:hypothetical protein
MLGTVATQGFFASAHFIQMSSNVWAEWNYNSIAQPFVVSTTSATPIYWGPDRWNSTYQGNKSYAWTPVNSQTTINYSGSARSAINAAKTIPSSHYMWSGSADGKNITSQISLVNTNSDIISSSLSLGSNYSGYYKAVFFIKGITPFINRYVDPITNLVISASTAGTSSYQYVVQTVGSNGQVLKIYMSPSVNAKNVDGTQPISFTWNATPGKEIAYNIYKTCTKQYIFNI